MLNLVFGEFFIPSQKYAVHLHTPVF